MELSSNARLTAAYSSAGSNGKFFTEELPRISQKSSTGQKTDYLATLRSSATQMQKNVNEFLTHKMEEDKANVGGQAEKTKEDEEEENYGEEARDS